MSGSGQDVGTTGPAANPAPEPPPEAPRTAILVLGMHRAGTSLLARMLNLLGCDAPHTLIGPSENNQAGYWESRPVRELNDRVLASAGTEWDDWRAVPAAWLGSSDAADLHAEALALLASEFGDSQLFVLKDPRICRLAPFWLGVLRAAGAEARAVLALRNPLEVAASLGARNAMAPGHSHLLWLRHMLDAEAGTRGLPRVVADHQRILDDWVGQAEHVGGALRLTGALGRARAVDAAEAPVRSDLHHHSRDVADVENDPAVPGWARAAHAILRGWAESGENLDDHPRLDAIRRDLDAAGPVFGDAMADGRRAVTALQQANRRAEKLEAQVNVRIEEIARLSRILQGHEAGLSILRTLHAARVARARAWPLALRRDMATVRASGLFDAQWYLRSNPDVASSGLDPLRHFVRHGLAEGRRPNAGLVAAPDPVPVAPPPGDAGPAA